jgi:hypothetical protein
MTDARMLRQTLLIPQAMQDCTVVLVGLGMLGSWTAHVLSRTCKGVIGYDFDTVGNENIGTQAYDQLDVGTDKAAALAGDLIGLPFTSFAQRFDGALKGEDIRTYGYSPATTDPLVVVSAVDSFEGRRMVAEWAKSHADLFIDTRAHGTVGVVVTVPVIRQPGLLDVGGAIALYLKELESDGASAPDPQCGAEGTAFVGLWVAQQVASTMVRHFMGLPVPYKTVYDVAMGEAITVEQESPLLARLLDEQAAP